MAEELPVRRQEPPEPTWEKDWVEVVTKPGEDERVVLWEYHPQHPHNEAFLVPGPARFVALTPQVSDCIMRGKVRRVAEPAETLEEHLYKTGTKAESPGDYHHIAKAPAAEMQALRPRPKPTGRR